MKSRRHRTSQLSDSPTKSNCDSSSVETEITSPESPCFEKNPDETASVDADKNRDKEDKYVDACEALDKETSLRDDPVTASKKPSLTQAEPEETIRAKDDIIEYPSTLPVGWKLIQASFDDFARQYDEWKVVQGRADFVLTSLPVDENNEECMKQLVRHCGMTMKLRGVCYMICDFIQFSKLHSIVSNEGMQTIKHPMIYIQYLSTVQKKRFLNTHKYQGSLRQFFGGLPIVN